MNIRFRNAYIEKIEKISKKLLTEYKKGVIICKVFCFTPSFLGADHKNVRARAMFEKNLNIGYLLDFYGDVLTERRRDALDFYYNNDMSLSEIAEEMGISRQGVRDLIKKAEEELLFYEEKLGLAKKLADAQKHAKRAIEICSDSGADEELKREIELLLETVG